MIKGLFSEEERKEMLRVLLMVKADHDEITLTYPTPGPCECDFCKDILRLIGKLSKEEENDNAPQESGWHEDWKETI